MVGGIKVEGDRGKTDFRFGSRAAGGAVIQEIPLSTKFQVARSVEDSIL